MAARTNMNAGGQGEEPATNPEEQAGIIQEAGGKYTSRESGTPQVENVGIPVRVVFVDQGYSLGGFTDLMEGLEALVTICMAEPSEVLRPKARAKLADSVVIGSIRKDSPLEIQMYVQTAIDSLGQLLTLCGGFIALQSLHSRHKRKAAQNTECQLRAELEQKAIRHLMSQFDGLSKKERKKLGKKELDKIVQQAAGTLVSIESISSSLSDMPTPKPTTSTSRRA